MNCHQLAAISEAPALIARAAIGDHAGVWTLADEIANSDHARETLTVLAEHAAAFAGAVADLKLQPVGTVLDLLAGVSARMIAEGES